MTARPAPSCPALAKPAAPSGNVQSIRPRQRAQKPPDALEAPYDANSTAPEQRQAPHLATDPTPRPRR